MGRGCVVSLERLRQKDHQNPGVRDLLLSICLHIWTHVCRCAHAGPLYPSGRLSPGCRWRLLAVLKPLTKESLATSTTLGAWATCSFCSCVPGVGAAIADAATVDTHSNNISCRGVQTRSPSPPPLDCFLAVSGQGWDPELVRRVAPRNYNSHQAQSRRMRSEEVVLSLLTHVKTILIKFRANDRSATSSHPSDAWGNAHALSRFVLGGSPVCSRWVLVAFALSRS